MFDDLHQIATTYTIWFKTYTSLVVQSLWYYTCNVSKRLKRIEFYFNFGRLIFNLYRIKAT